MSKIALIVGIDDYPRSLNGCVADATEITALLAVNQSGSPNFECRTMFAPSQHVTRKALRYELRRLFEKRDVETAVFYFAGHGEYKEGLGGHLVTQDAAIADEGVAMEHVIGLANRSPARERIVILDCCHAGAIKSLLATQSIAPIQEGVSILAACRDTESALESNGRGLFTSRICDALSGGAADVTGKVTVASIYSYVDEVSTGWDQRPLFQSNVARITVVREAEAAVTIETLRKIDQYFSGIDDTFSLDSSFEPSLEPRNEANEKIFSHLQAMRAARLVEPNGAAHMYYAALEKKSCRLTPLGRYYWQRVRNKQL